MGYLDETDEKKTVIIISWFECHRNGNGEETRRGILLVSLETVHGQSRAKQLEPLGRAGPI